MSNKKQKRGPCISLRLVTSESVLRWNRQLLKLLRRQFQNDLASIIYSYNLGFEGQQEANFCLQGNVEDIHPRKHGVAVVKTASDIHSYSLIKANGETEFTYNFPQNGHVKANQQLWIWCSYSQTLMCKDLDLSFDNIQNFDVFGANQAVALTSQKELWLLPEREVLATNVKPLLQRGLILSCDTILFFSDNRLMALFLRDRAIVHIADDVCLPIGLALPHILQFKTTHNAWKVRFNLMTRSVDPTDSSHWAMTIDPWSSEWLRKDVALHLSIEKTCLSVSPFFEQDLWKFSVSHKECSSCSIGQVRQLATGELIVVIYPVGVFVLDFHTNTARQLPVKVDATIHLAPCPTGLWIAREKWLTFFR